MPSNLLLEILSHLILETARHIVALLFEIVVRKFR